MELPQNIRLLLEALRGGGHMVGGKHVIGPAQKFNDGMPVGALTPVRNDLNYTKYVRQEKAMGSEPVSYEEWMMGR
jgi:hypothetical protein